MKSSMPFAVCGSELWYRRHSLFPRTMILSLTREHLQQCDSCSAQRTCRFHHCCSFITFDLLFHSQRSFNSCARLIILHLCKEVFLNGRNCYLLNLLSEFKIIEQFSGCLLILRFILYNVITYGLNTPHFTSGVKKRSLAGGYCKQTQVRVSWVAMETEGAQGGVGDRGNRGMAATIYFSCRFNLGCRIYNQACWLLSFPTPIFN